MNAQVKTILLTVLTLSVFTIAIVELTGVSSHSLYNKFGIGTPPSHGTDLEERNQRTTEINKMPKTEIAFEQDHFDFGKVKLNTKVRHAFRFLNIGENPLMIADAQASCGCTIPSFSKAPVMPGDYGEITVEFNTAGRLGTNHKSVMVFSNAKREHVSVSFDAEVVRADGSSAGE
jgi:hypothetical protein